MNEEIPSIDRVTLDEFVQPVFTSILRHDSSVKCQISIQTISCMVNSKVKFND